jgi:hypothetical protein
MCRRRDGVEMCLAFGAFRCMTFGTREKSALLTHAGFSLGGSGRRLPKPCSTRKEFIRT